MNILLATASASSFRCVAIPDGGDSVRNTASPVVLFHPRHQLENQVTLVTIGT